MNKLYLLPKEAFKCFVSISEQILFYNTALTDWSL